MLLIWGYYPRRASSASFEPTPLGSTKARPTRWCTIMFAEPLIGGSDVEMGINRQEPQRVKR